MSIICQELISPSVLYCNINYFCNQKCIFCFSHNTNFYSDNTEIPYKEFENSLIYLGLKKQDRIIINGGEPTLHKHFKKIIACACSYGAETIIYSNGSSFVSESFTKQILNLRPDRITIPIHGNQPEHDFITKTPGAYFRTFQGINNICKYQHQPILELKFIITETMVKENFSCFQYILKNNLLSSCISVVVTGQVNTKCASTNKFICTYNDNYMHYAEKQIEELLKIIPVKIYDLPFCRFSKSFYNKICQNTTHLYTPQCNYFFLDFKHLLPQKMYYSSVYKTNNKCSSCMAKNICHSIQNNYWVLMIDKTEKKLVME